MSTLEQIDLDRAKRAYTQAGGEPLEHQTDDASFYWRKATELWRARAEHAESAMSKPTNFDCPSRFMLYVAGDLNSEEGLLGRAQLGDDTVEGRISCDDYGAIGTSSIRLHTLVEKFTKNGDWDEEAETPEDTMGDIDSALINLVMFARSSDFLT